MRLRVGIAIIGLFTFGWCGSATGAPVTEVVKRDLAPAAGVVVTVESGEILLDLDAGDGLNTGDLVAVLGEGKPLTHPVTEEVIGTLETTKAVLSVTRVRDGFSHARPVEPPESPIRRGDPVRRFSEMPVRFWDYAGDGEALFRRLRDALPTLKWADYDADQAVRPQRPAAPENWAGLVFLLRDDVLEIRAPDFQRLYAYRLTEGDARTAPRSSSAAEDQTPASVPATGVMPAATPTPAGAEADDAPAFSPDFGSMTRHGVLPGGTHAMGVFLSRNNRLLLATCAGNTVRVFSVEDALVPLATAEMEVNTTVFAVQWWLPEGAETPYLAATAFDDEEMESMVFAFREDELRPVERVFGAILGSLDRNGDGRPETLLRQDFDRDIFWGIRVREIIQSGNGLADAPPPMDLPRKFTAVGSLSADLTGSGRPELAVVRGQTLLVFSDGEPVFETPGMGGSLSRIVYAINPEQRDALTRGETLEIDPVAVDLDGDGRPELIAPASSQSTVTVASIYSGFKSTQLAVFSYRNGNFIKGTLGAELDQPVQGLTVHDGQVYLLVSQLGNFFGDGGESRLMSFRVGE
ncbi:MAG: hypothetical protein ACLFRG_10230 [Desulfococcaceae bacterium]